MPHRSRTPARAGPSCPPLTLLRVAMMALHLGLSMLIHGPVRGIRWGLPSR